MQLIVNADDFGRSQPINQAVALAWEEGILTSASLMVTGEAARDAVSLARQHPGKAVGLHLTLTELPPALPPEQVPHLIDSATGRLPADPAVMGWRLFWNRHARRELAAELSAQFQRFEQTDLPLSHVDGHQHLHVHPVVLELLLPLAEKYDATGFRLPREPLPRWRDGEDWRTAMRQVAHAGVFACLCSHARNQLANYPDRFVPDRAYGLMYSGAMHEARVLALLHTPPAAEESRCIEFYFHPAVGARVDALGPNENDLLALLSPRVRRAITTAGLRPTTYARAREEAASSPQSRAGNVAPGPPMLTS